MKPHPYRSPAPLAKLPPHTPWWRLLRAWAEGTFNRIRWARSRREGARIFAEAVECKVLDCRDPQHFALIPRLDERYHLGRAIPPEWFTGPKAAIRYAEHLLAVRSLTSAVLRRRGQRA